VNIKVRSLSTDIFLHAVYEEAMISLVEHEDIRTSTYKKFLKAFSLRLDDIKIGQNTLSGNFIHFTRYYHSTLFDVSFGLEEATAKVYKAASEEQALDLFGRLFQILDVIPIKWLRVTISQQLVSDSDPDLYLESLNPNVPKNFRDTLDGRGVQYNLRIPPKNLKSYITISSSVLHDNGLFLSVDNLFLPYEFDFKTFSKIVIEQYEFVLKELNVKIQKEGRNG
jgi:hypothetical protein